MFQYCTCHIHPYKVTVKDFAIPKYTVSSYGYSELSASQSSDAYSGTSGRLFRRHPDTKPELSGHLADRFDFTVTIPKLQYCGIV